jgi:hypothetical protein
MRHTPPSSSRFTLACALAGLAVASPAALADALKQERAGLMWRVPFDSQGVRWQASELSVVFQHVNVRESDRVSGWQLSVGSPLTSFSPTWSVSALVGERCWQGALGLSYGAGVWGWPVSLQGPYSVLSASNRGAFGGWQAGLSSLGCFKRVTPAAAALAPAPAPAPVVAPTVAPAVAPAPAPSSGSGSGSQVVGAQWLRIVPDIPDFDWA